MTLKKSFRADCWIENNPRLRAVGYFSDIPYGNVTVKLSNLNSSLLYGSSAGE